MVRYETLAVLAVFILSLAQAYLVVVSTEDVVSEAALHGRATSGAGSASLCINWPSEINLSDCPVAINQSTEVLDYTHTCLAEGIHPDDHDVLLFSEHVNVSGLNFSVSTAGLVTIWANQTGVGNYSVTLYAEDIFQCPFVSEKVFDFEIMQINDPPRLIANIPSQDIPVNIEISAFSLDDYFSDPDGDPLVYDVVGASEFEVILEGSSVSFFVTDDFCGEEHIYFTATDVTERPPQNYTVDSNMVTLNAVCPPEEDDDDVGRAPAPPPDRCTPEWQCERWGRCYPNGTQSRRCVDLAGCDPNNLERLFWQDCEYIPDPEPEEEEVVEEEEEEEVEPELPERERPVLVDEDEREIVGVIIGVLIGLSVLLFLYVLFKKEIKGAYARLSWWLTRKARKEVLLSDAQKEELLKLVSEAEHALSLDDSKEFKSSGKVVRGIVSAQRLYVKHALGLQLEFVAEDLERVSQKKILHDPLRNVFKLLFRKLSYLEQRKFFVSRLHVSLLIEELRQLVLNTSSYSKDDYGFVAKESPVSGSALDKCVALLYNAMVALEFREVSAAEEKYISLLKFYEELPEEKKSLVYDDIARLYHNIKYVLSWA